MKIKVEGMSCGHCSSRVEKALNAISGVQSTVHLDTGVADIQLTADVSEEQLRKAIEDAGYGVAAIES